MSDFNRAIPVIRRHECAPACVAGNHAACFTNDPDDPGKATCCGIIQTTYDAWRDFNGVPKQAVQRHTDEERLAIYDKRFWQRARCDVLPWPLSLLHFDAAVNHGTEPGLATKPKVNAGRLLQLAAQVTPVDGQVGPNTLAAVALWNVHTLCYRYLCERFFRYDDLADQNPRLVKYEVGAWEERLKNLYRLVSV